MFCSSYARAMAVPHSAPAAAPTDLPSGAPEEVRFDLPARDDGHPLAAARFDPGSAPPTGVAATTVVIAPAMAVGQGFYAPFARWLAKTLGVRVVTFDYRGMGRSRRGRSARAFPEVTVRTWAERDAPGVLDWVAETAPEHAVGWVGHSLGAQILGLMPDADRVDRVLTVAAGSGYYGHHPRQRRIRKWLFRSWMPAAARILGFFPGRRLGIVGDLPRGIALEWARWCANPHYAVDDRGRPDRDGFRSFAAPILALSFEDDDLIVRRAVDDLHGWFQAAPVTRRHLTPEELGVDGVGHFGFFRNAALWPLARPAFVGPGQLPDGDPAVL